jgi:hypothetical protein
MVKSRFETVMLKSALEIESEAYDCRSLVCNHLVSTVLSKIPRTYVLSRVWNTCASMAFYVNPVL